MANDNRPTDPSKVLDRLFGQLPRVEFSDRLRTAPLGWPKRGRDDAEVERMCAGMGVDAEDYWRHIDSQRRLGKLA